MMHFDQACKPPNSSFLDAMQTTFVQANSVAAAIVDLSSHVGGVVLTVNSIQNVNRP